MHSLTVDEWKMIANAKKRWECSEVVFAASSYTVGVLMEG